ncbi:MAG: hypothetical protein OEZ43_11310 [Gammaproteobacteria bacterium]|nr:hypothetical protein [Gammaproteobacteria bacterium]
MQWENLFYALTQLVHNFGAMAVVGGALATLYLAAEKQGAQRKLAWLVLIGWGAQAASGISFGAISFYFYGETPDLHATAQVAFIIKLFCATSGGILALFYVISAHAWADGSRRRAWKTLTLFGVVALSAAAFLRWFS